MKKLNILAMAALAAGILSSCEDAPAVAPIQENPQGPILNTDGIKATPIVAADLDLDQLKMDDAINFFTISADSVVAESFDIIPKLQLSDTESFEGTVVDIATAFADGNVSVNAEDMHMAMMDMFGDDVNPNTVYYRLYADIENKETKSVYRFGAPDYYLSTGSVKVTPMVSQMVIETNVVKTPGSFNGWNGDASQYLYNVKVDGEYSGRYVGSALISGEGFKFLTTDGSWIGMNTEAPGTFGDTNIAPTDGDGLYWIDMNIDEKTYSITKINSVGIIGAMTNWASDVDMTPNDDFSVWSVETDVNGEWKIRMNADWGMNYGGALLSPTFDGSNFATTGTALVTINFSGHHPVIKLKKK